MSFGDGRGGGSVSDSNIDTFATDAVGGTISIDRDTGAVSIDGTSGGNLNDTLALADAARRQREQQAQFQAQRQALQQAELERAALAQQAASLQNLQLDQLAQTLADEAATLPPQSPVVATGLQPVFSFLGRLGPQVFRDLTGKIDPIQTAAANTPAVGSLMQFMDWFDRPGRWSRESPFEPNDAEQSSWDAMNPYSFPGDLPGGGFDRTAGEGGDPFQNIITPIETELALEEMEDLAPTLPAPETPTYDPALFYRPTLLDQPSGLPNFAALNDAFTRSYALRPGIYTDQPNLLGYTPYA